MTATNDTQPTVQTPIHPADMLLHLIITLLAPMGPSPAPAPSPRAAAATSSSPALRRLKRSMAIALTATPT